jgi:hypothetical protein
LLSWSSESDKQQTVDAKKKNKTLKKKIDKNDNERLLEGILNELSDVKV